MTDSKICDKREESIISQLSSLYRQYGYKRYKADYFEEYALYQENRDFLIGKNVITFSDLNGKLMAMRPDVTLSLIRHNPVGENTCDKFFYNEKVYRQSAGGRYYKEISQTGVEVIGSVDMAVVCELTILICKTLSAVSDNYILDISHMGFTEGLLNEFGSDRELLSQYLKIKNLHDFYVLAESRKYPQRLIEAFKIAVNACGTPKKVLEFAKSAILNSIMRDAVRELSELCDTLGEFGLEEKLNINFSATANADYYNGVIFNGYIENIPHCVLSGGRYDKLVKKFRKTGGAIGFALYLGEIARYLASDDENVDYLIVYNEKTQIEALKTAQKLISEGVSVRISTEILGSFTFKNLINLSGGEANND
ncbi:MAG: ATP phosphoribosyltransferase regulatory subunit [Clostridiales bacterium]|nr:ATP phosphoribosyltransferase regulatory subunit [Clostridiales bacterium]